MQTQSTKDLTRTRKQCCFFVVRHVGTSTDQHAGHVVRVVSSLDVMWRAKWNFGYMYTIHLPYPAAARLSAATAGMPMTLRKPLAKYDCLYAPFPFNISRLTTTRSLRISTIFRIAFYNFVHIFNNPTGDIWLLYFIVHSTTAFLQFLTIKRPYCYAYTNTLMLLAS